MSKQRRRKIHDSLYGEKFGWLKCCVYCGDHAQTWDHVLPISMAAMLSDLPSIVKMHRRMLFKVPCCNHCNSMLGSRFFPTFRDRRTFVKQRLRKKFAKYLKPRPKWTDEELAELGPSLQRHVRHHTILAERARARVRF